MGVGFQLEPGGRVAVALEEARNRPLSRDEAYEVFAAALASSEALGALCQVASEVRDGAMAGRAVQEAAFNSVVPCELEPLCLYCPYWRGQGKRLMTIDEILGHVRFLQEQTDVRQFHLSGGSRANGQDSGVLEIAQAIHDAGFDQMRIVVNCGPSFSDAGLARLKECGVVRVFSVFETCDPALFAMVKPGDNLEEKRLFAQRIAQAGIEVGTGLMAGLGPAEGRVERCVDSLFEVAQLEGLSCLYISKFRHAKGIFLNDCPECPLDEALAFLAIARLVLRDVHIRAAAGWRASEKEAAWRAGEGSMSIPYSFSPSAGSW